MSIFSIAAKLPAQITALTAQVTTLTADLTAAQALVNTLTTERDNALAQAATLAAAVPASGAFILTAQDFTALSTLAESFGISGDQLTAALASSDFSPLAAALQAHIVSAAETRAVAIAASQGIPPLPTDPALAGSSPQADAAAAFAAAAAEPNPVLRALKFADAEKLIAKKQ